MRRIFVSGHKGMVGSAIVRRLANESGVTVLTAGRDELDLLNQRAVHDFIGSNRIDEVYLAAAKVGGIVANNTYRADFLYENLMIQNNVIAASHKFNVGKLLFLGSSCIYPKLANQPMKESELLTGELENTNEPYAIAKIAGLKLCQAYSDQYGNDFRAVMPTNLYGTGDNFHPENSHVIPGLMNRFQEVISNGKNELTIWGTGKPKREFLHVDDMASACVYVMSMSRADYTEMVADTPSHVNVGTGEDCSIAELASLLKDVTGFEGSLVYDTSKPDGTPRKLLDVSKLKAAGWKPEIDLKEGLALTWEWFVSSSEKSAQDKQVRRV